MGEGAQYFWAMLYIVPEKVNKKVVIWILFHYKGFGVSKMLECKKVRFVD